MVNEIKDNKTFLRPKGSASLIVSNISATISIGLHPNQKWEVGGLYGSDYILYHDNIIVCISKEEADRYFVPLSGS